MANEERGNAYIAFLNIRSTSLPRSFNEVYVERSTLCNDTGSGT